MKYENLKILSELRDKGSITEEEYQREKEKILNEDDTKPFLSNSKKPLFGLPQDTFLMILHLSQLFTLLIPVIGVVVPIILWLLYKDINPTVDRQGKDIVNFNISFLIYTTISAITVIGIPLAVILTIVYLVFVIKAAINTNSGKSYSTYPMTIQFIK